ncbi:MAG: SGNH/GDSL hydrolase family protein, partial [Propionibacteriaceae bacterium]|nr:SGNH/GDSL hydrolase family protein [Propionibacteriaceae bacterium]
LAHAAAGPGLVITGAEFTVLAGPAAAAVDTAPVADFPRDGDTYAVLSTGRAADLTWPLAHHSTALGGAAADWVYDVTTWRVDFTVPNGANCLTGIDFAFFSEEYPQFVGSNYNDALIIELDASDWTVSGHTIAAPRNIAFDQAGNPITVNAAGAATMSAEQAAGTTFQGATATLTAATPLSPGPHSLFVTVFDATDSAFDSTALIDNIRVGHVADLSAQCEPGAQRASTYVALGDSYASGYGVTPFEKGTHVFLGNDCQRSLNAYSAVVEEYAGLRRDFHACRAALTNDLFQPFVVSHGLPWGEAAQFDHLDDSTGLVTLTIGGNDAGFAEVLAECALGVELLPFNTCWSDDKVAIPVMRALYELKGFTHSSDTVHSYDEIFAAIKARAPYAQVVAVGYPPLYVSGGGRGFLPDRCQLIKKADQRWMLEQIKAINTMMAVAAARQGYLFADPTERFIGHELCSGDEWIYGVLPSGRMHPTEAGQAAIGQAVVDAMRQAGLDAVTLKPDETSRTIFIVEDGVTRTTVTVRWPGHPVETTLVSPSGVVYSAAAATAMAAYEAGPNFEQFAIAEPEAGEWTVLSQAAEADPEGESVTVVAAQETAPNSPPAAVLAVTRVGGQLRLDASGSADADGELTAFDWYVATATADYTATGPSAVVQIGESEPASVTLAVADDRGEVAFAAVSVLPTRLSGDGLAHEGEAVAVAVLGSPGFDVAAVDAATVALSGAAAATALEDVDGNGHLDLVVSAQPPAADADEICLTGRLTDGRAFANCHPLTWAAPAADPPPSLSASPEPEPSAWPDTASSPLPPPDPPPAANLSQTGAMASLGLVGAGVLALVSGLLLLAAHRQTA